MYDRDVVALQIGASVIESNEFLIHVLNRLGMWAWLDENIDALPKVTLRPVESDRGYWSQDLMSVVSILLNRRMMIN
jgi:E3 ubiquitin-protein ligase UBR2